MRLFCVLRCFGTIAALLALGGCATQAQKQYQQMETQLKYAISQSEICQADIKKHDAYQRLETIFILGSNDPDAVKKMLIDRVASRGEKEDLLHYNNSSARCRKNSLETLGSVHPDFVSLLGKWYAENDELMVMIIKEEVTIGKANEILNKRMAERNDQWNAVASGITQQLQTSHQSEMANRQAAAAAMQQWSNQQQLLYQQQQMINSINRPTMTNCSYLGNSINCTSY